MPTKSPYYYGGSVANAAVKAPKVAPKTTAAKVAAGAVAGAPAATNPAPLSVRQQAINQVNAVNAASTSAADVAAQKAMNDAKAQAMQALGFQNALDVITQGDSGRIFDAYGNAADKMSAYGDLALASAGDSSRSDAQQAQSYLASVGPDVGAETRPDIAGALLALGATGVSDPAEALRAQGAYAQERSRQVRNAQLMRLADIGANASYQGVQTANQLRADEVTRQAKSREADVIAAMAAIRDENRAQSAETRARHADIREAHADVRAKHEDIRAAHADVREAHADVRAKHAGV